jgi:multiple sugar transport system substrate-binding protein
MSDTQWDGLVSQLKSHKIGRRQFMIKAAAAGFSASAIAGTVAGIRSTPVRAQDMRKVTFWTAFTDPDLAVLKSMVDTYNAQATDHQVELVQQPPAGVTDTTKLMTAVRGGTGPDIYHLDRFIVAQRAADGLIQDLSVFPDAVEYIGNYLEFAKAEATYNGAPYALPFDTDTRALYYNKTMLASVGVDPEEFDRSNGPVTWERVAEVAAMLDVKDSNGNYTQMGFVPWVNQGWHYTYGFSWQGTFYDPAACKVTPDDPKIVEAFQWVQDYCNARGADAVSAFGSPSMADGFPSQQHPFILDTLAMQITGDWVISQLAQYSPDKDYGITWMPVPAALASAPATTDAAASPVAAGGGASTTWAGGWSVVIPDGAKNSEDAWTFMKWFAGAEGQAIYVKGTSHLPTWSALLNDDSLFDEGHAFFAKDLLPTAKSRPALPVGAKYWDELTVAWQATYLNQGAPGDLLKTAADNTNKDLEGFCPVS